MTQSKKQKISFIVPAFKESKMIETNLKEMKKELDSIGIDYEVIVVDDGSTDNTYQIVKSFASKNKNFKVVGYKKNKGKGHAIKYGFRYTKADIIGFLDADMDIHPRQTRLFLDLIGWNNADIVIGSKRHHLSKVKYPATRRFLSEGYQFLIGLVFGLPLSDTQVGFKLFRRKVLENVLPRIVVKQYAFDLELLVIAHKIGSKIIEAPIDLDYQNIGSNINFKTIWNIFVDTCGIAYRLYILKYYN